MLDDYCPAAKLQLIVDTLSRGDKHAAELLYKDCYDNIRNQNTDLNRFTDLQMKFWTDGLTSAESSERDQKKVSGLNQVRDMRHELLDTVKAKQKEDGVCKIDLDAHGNPYAVDTAITCKK